MNPSRHRPCLTRRRIDLLYCKARKQSSGRNLLGKSILLRMVPFNKVESVLFLQDERQCLCLTRHCAEGFLFRDRTWLSIHLRSGARPGGDSSVGMDSLSINEGTGCCTEADIRPFPPVSPLFPDRGENGGKGPLCSISRTV